MTTVDNERSVKQVAAVAACMVIGTLGPAVLLMLPGLLAALSEHYGFDEQQLGLLSFADLGGLTVGSALSTRLFSITGVARGTRLGLLGAVVANGISAFVVAFAPLLLIRAFAGLAGGILVGSCYMMLGRLKHVDRNFGIYLICQGIFGAIALKTLPALSHALGVAGIFAILACLYAAALVLPRFLLASEPPPQRESDIPVLRTPAWMGLAGVVVFFVAQGAVWAYLELIGLHGGLDSNVVSTALALSTLVGLVGPLIAALLGSRLGRVFPLSVALFTALASLALLNLPLDSARFALAACLFYAAWNLSIPYQLAALAEIDTSGKLVIWAASGSLAGLAIGPPIGGMVIASKGTSGVLIVCAALYIASLIALLPALNIAAKLRSRRAT